MSAISLKDKTAICKQLNALAEKSKASGDTSSKITFEIIHMEIDKQMCELIQVTGNIRTFEEVFTLNIYKDNAVSGFHRGKDRVLDIIISGISEKSEAAVERLYGQSIDCITNLIRASFKKMKI